MSTIEQPLLSVKGISKLYENGKNGLLPLSFEIHFNERVGIVGETGSGKSTLMKIMAGLIEPDSGDVIFNNQKVKGPNETLIPGHKDIAYLSQHFELPKFISVHDHLHDSYLIAPDEAERIYNACKITHLMGKKTIALSGGEKQRVALAKILIRKPKILLLDEPFSNLDFNHKLYIKQVLDDVESVLNTTLVLVAHDPLDVLSWAHRILVFSKGKVVQDDNPETTYQLPRNEYVAGLFGPYNLVSTKQFGVSQRDDFTQIGNKSIIRPEKFRIQEEGKGVTRGKIINVRYFGAYNELTIQTTSTQLIVRSAINTHNLYDEVGVGLLQEDASSLRSPLFY